MQRAPLGTEPPPCPALPSSPHCATTPCPFPRKWLRPSQGGLHRSISRAGEWMPFGVPTLLPPARHLLLFSVPPWAHRLLWRDQTGRGRVQTTVFCAHWRTPRVRATGSDRPHSISPHRVSLGPGVTTPARIPALNFPSRSLHHSRMTVPKLLDRSRGVAEFL